MRYLVAIDGSEPGDLALERALELTDAAGAVLTAVHVVTPEVYDEGSETPITSLAEAERKLVIESIADAEVRGERVLAEAEERAGNAGVDVETVLLYGNPINEILDYAEREGFDAIYVGHRGLSDRAEELLGSVANELVRRASVPVMVVR